MVSIPYIKLLIWEVLNKKISSLKNIVHILKWRVALSATFIIDVGAFFWLIFFFFSERSLFLNDIEHLFRSITLADFPKRRSSHRRISINFININNKSNVQLLPHSRLPQTHVSILRRMEIIQNDNYSKITRMFKCYDCERN